MNSNGKCEVCGSTLEPKPVAGAVRFPQRLECPVHGYLSPDSPSFSPEDGETLVSEEAVLQFQEQEKIRAVNQGQGLGVSGNRSLPVSRTRITKEMRDQIRPPDITSVTVTSEVANALKSNKQTPAIGQGNSIRIEYGNRTQMSRYPREMEKQLDELEAEWRKNQLQGVIPPTADETNAIRELFQMPELCLILTEDERMAYMQHSFLGLSLGELAVQTGKPKATIQSVVARAHDKLVVYLQKLLKSQSSESELYLRLRSALKPEQSDSLDVEIENYVSTLAESDEPDSTNPDGSGFSVRKVR